MDNLPFLPVEQLAKLLASGEITSHALTRVYLDRIARLNTQLNAYVEVFEDSSLAQARCSDLRREAGCALGPLDGIPIAVKDLCHIAGYRNTVGSRLFSESHSTMTATAIQRLVAAGAVLLGKTQMVEFAFGGWGTNPYLGTPRNPWDMKAHRIPGGSSSGSGVALAAGLCAAAIGSDTGGSVRIPASLNGITGLKTTAGLISLHGCAELSPTLDSLGPLTRSAADAALLTEIMAGYDAADPRTHHAPRLPADFSRMDDGEAKASAPLQGKVIALIPPENYPMPVVPAVSHALEAAAKVFANLGADVREVEFPFDFGELMRVNGAIIAAEAYVIHQAYIEDTSREIGQWVRQRVLHGRDISAVQYIDALKEHSRVKRAWVDWMSGLDALLVPTLPIAACKVEDVDEMQTPLAAFTRAGNLLGASVLSLPAGFDEQRLPVGVQLYGKPFDEAGLISLGRRFQSQTDWHLQFPEL
ncbi:amidase [Allopusillimonas ginsengisoli]|uniref:amidase n=1 Tax=Allopusillimonas ginsengisoli TaxID=453575 RepID=UPI0010C1CF9F|nr:amidase [Allopusillimonas ginsengisoli]